MTAFAIDVPHVVLDDLRARLLATRWPDAVVDDWSQGVPLQKAEALVAYWRDKYGWRRFEARINAFPQYRTQIDGFGIHFIHVRSPHRNALPIILTHGWPGSFVEFMEIIGPLSDPTRFGGRAEDAFHVVVPSLPGFAFSDKPVETPYRDHSDVLFKRDFGGFWLDNFPHLRVVSYGFAWKRVTGLDNLTWWLFEKR